MSEYQYYEFLAIDHCLTTNDVAYLRNISTRATITSASFINEYHWGDLKAEPLDLMQRFFDAHIYLANWGDAVLMLKLPSSCIDHKLLKAFSSQEYLSVKKLPEHWLLIWSAGESEDYERFAYHEGNDWMPRLAPLREELLRGDYRSLYIGWLRAVTTGDIADHEHEPMLLNNLGDMTAAQQALADFIKVDEDLLAGTIVADSSTHTPEADESAINAWLKTLPETEVHDYLLQLLNGQSAHAERNLKRRYNKWQTDSQSHRSGSTRRVEELWQLARQAKELRLQREAQAKRRAEAASQKKRKAKLSLMVNDLPREWMIAHDEANKQHGKAYDKVCRQLVDLRDAYTMFRSTAEFKQALDKFLDTHRRRHTLKERLVKDGLLQAKK